MFAILLSCVGGGWSWLWLQQEVTSAARRAGMTLWTMQNSAEQVPVCVILGGPSNGNHRGGSSIRCDLSEGITSFNCPLVTSCK
jgi:hypothetical protein